jgi:hypothetical protein
MDDVPIAFFGHAKKLLDSYQQAIACKSKPRAILSDRGYFAGELPSKLKPDVIRREKGQYTYTWFLAEYRTAPLSRKGRRVKARPYYGAKKAEKLQAYWRAPSAPILMKQIVAVSLPTPLRIDYGGALRWQVGPFKT